MRKTLLLIISLIPLITRAQESNSSWENDRLLMNRIFVEGFHKLNPDSIFNYLVPKIIHERDSLLRQDNVSADDLQSITYYYANGLIDLSNSLMQNPSRNQPWKILADKVFSEIALPKTKDLELHQNSYADKYIANYVRHELKELFLQTREQGTGIIVKALQLPLDSLEKISKQFGDMALGIRYAKTILTTSLTKHFLSNQLRVQLDLRNLQLSHYILDELIINFPNDESIPEFKKNIDELHKTAINNSKNPDIIFVENPESIHSPKALLAPFYGKVVYLDFWGTWCGPCVLELTQYTQQLKAHFKGRNDIVFLYIAMEDESTINKWKQFIALHHITGYHIMKTNREIEPFWIELLGTENTPRRYPMYMIIDRKGNVVDNDALRPSHEKALYLELEQILKK